MVRWSIRSRKASSEYFPRHRERSLLYRAIAEELETFLARQQERDRAAPRFVERERYLAGSQ